MSNKTNKVKVCSINICGMSDKSRIALDHYVNAEKFHIVTIQETIRNDSQSLHLTNMSGISDSNSSKNRGAALYVNKIHNLTKLKKIDDISKNIDTTRGFAVINNRKYILGSVYVKLNQPNAIEQVIQMLNKSHNLMNKFKASGIIVSGDFNARHVSWGDETNNEYGDKLVTNLDSCKFSVLTSESPTFLAGKGSSIIDLTIISNNLVEKVESCHTDTFVELFTGSPERGHVPLITTFNLSGNAHPMSTVEKINLNTINWDEWSKELEDLLGRNEEFLNSSDPTDLGLFIDKAIQTVTNNHCEKKIVSQHSKPFWTPELERLCRIMRNARKTYFKRNTDANSEKLKEAKLEFDEARKEECRKFILEKTKNLNNVQKQKFWKEFKKIFKMNSDHKIEPLLDSDGSFLTDNADMERKMFNVFFEGEHLKTANFDETFFNEVNNIYSDIMNEGSENTDTNKHLKELNAEITISEIKAAIKTYKASGKSSDKEEFNPKMFRHLGDKAIIYLTHLANQCLNKGKWIWNKSEVIFLRKSGKKSYSDPGSYRPISISSYIGKLIEKIIAQRIQRYLNLIGLYDLDQEGFMEARNTIRYLNRLILGIKSDIQKKLTCLCLFIDFEKAFDSVNKKALIVKLHQLGIRGKVLFLINDFLINRKLTININGVVGSIRECSDVGLPQGSALSPILFRIFVMDLVQKLNERDDVTIFKFADDGTIKATAKSSQICIETMNTILSEVDDWARKNRMIINCQPNKTEVIAFSTAEQDKNVIPSTFKLGQSCIKRVQHTKVLGLILDEDLNFNEHCNSICKKLLASWAIICQYSNRHWGFKQHVLIQIIKTLWLPKIFYAGHIWLSNKSIKDINSIFYKLIKSTIGAVFNMRHSFAEIILGIPPIHVTNEMNKIKHFLKIQLSQIPEDRLVQFISEELHNSHHGEVHHSVKTVFKFLKWKLSEYPKSIASQDIDTITSSKIENFFSLSVKTCKYTKTISNKYVEYLWQNSIRYELQMEGHNNIPKPSCLPFPLSSEIPREIEVKVMSLFYQNNLLNSSLNRINPLKFPSPLCVCETECQSGHHILFRCPFLEDEIKTDTYNLLVKIVGENQAATENPVTLLNASRNKEFISKICKIVILQSKYLHTTIEL